jgi:hypothetical protein
MAKEGTNIHSQTNGDTEVIQHAAGCVELHDDATIKSSPLDNEDLAPVPVSNEVRPSVSGLRAGELWSWIEEKTSQQ